MERMSNHRLEKRAMKLKKINFESEFYTNSEILPELTANKVRDILLVSSLYNIFNMEEGGILASMIDSEYKGLRLENPPRIMGVSTTEEALSILKEKHFDMVLLVPHLDKKDVFSFSLEIKKIKPEVPVILLSQNTREISMLLAKPHSDGIDGIYRWFGSPDLLLAIVKNREDHMNVEYDTKRANLRVLIFVEDSPEYYSYILPIFYKEVVNQTQALMEVGLTEKQRALTLRQRPKILLAKTYEEALELCLKYRPYLFCVAADTRIPRNGTVSASAGLDLLLKVSQEKPDIPLLLMSSEGGNEEKAAQHSIMFLDKTSPNLAKKIHNFFLDQLGFGDFIFRNQKGHEIARATNFLTLEKMLRKVPDESILYHADRHHFTRWVMARSEISLALKFRSMDFSDFRSVDDLREFLIVNINALRKYRQKGVVSQFNSCHFDADVREFVKMGQGSLGGKARGLAFMADLFRQHDELRKNHPNISIRVPKTLVICTDVFDAFVNQNNLRSILRQDLSDEEVTRRFLNTKVTAELREDLLSYLKLVRYPLSVRSSSQMEDAHYQPYAGLYRTYKIPNNHSSIQRRLEQLITAIKLVYASTYFQGPRSYSKSTSNQHGKESMAVVVQELVGKQYGDYYYPAVSGIAQSYNFYPFSRMKAEEGVVHMALGLGKTVVDGEKCIRFSPKYPNNIPEFSVVSDILKNSQQEFYALKTRRYPPELNFHKHSNLEKRDLSDAIGEFPVDLLSSTFIPSENRLRDTMDLEGPKVLTFSRILKYDLFGLPAVLSDLLELGEMGFGCPVEIEFAANINPDLKRSVDLYFLQIRPMFSEESQHNVEITEHDKFSAFCHSTQALGNGIRKMNDIVFIKPESFKKEATLKIAGEIERINKSFRENDRTYLLAGPGRWGGSDRWLGIPVRWHQISNVGAIVELRNSNMNADPSQGSHFFHNITSLGIHYIMLDELSQGNGNGDFLDWDWLHSLPVVSETPFVRHVKLEEPIVLKIDGRTSECVIIRPEDHMPRN